MATTKDKETSINEALANIQAKLSVPKTHKNQFGGYLFRNTSDILDAAKPLAKAENCNISINDELVMIGDRFYIKATASLTNARGESVSTNAYAREELSKKGLDASQVTGAASSYARKYALNGLFAIDDTADADTLNTSKGYTQPDNTAALATAKSDSANIKSRDDFEAWWVKYPNLQQNQEFLTMAQELGKKFPKTEQ